MTPTTGFHSFSLEPFPEIKEGASITDAIPGVLNDPGIALEPDDVLVITSKAVSVSEGRHVHLGTITPSKDAVEMSARTGKPAEVVQLILDESTDYFLATEQGPINRSCKARVASSAGRVPMPSGRLIASFGKPREISQDWAIVGNGSSAYSKRNVRAVAFSASYPPRRRKLCSSCGTRALGGQWRRAARWGRGRQRRVPAARPRSGGQTWRAGSCGLIRTVRRGRRRRGSRVARRARDGSCPAPRGRPLPGAEGGCRRRGLRRR